MSVRNLKIETNLNVGDDDILYEVRKKTPK